MTDYKKDSKGVWIQKDPNAVLDYQVDWSAWLGLNETIVTSSWTTQLGITNDSTSHAGSVATIWLSGGTLGKEYLVSNRIVTSAGRQEVRSFRVAIVSR